MAPIQYAEYKDLVEILSRSNHDTTYSDLIQKEEKVLDTVNAVVKYHQDKKIDRSSFVDMKIVDMIYNFVIEMGAMFREMVAIPSNHPEKIFTVITKGNRFIYLGIILVVFATLLALT